MPEESVQGQIDMLKDYLSWQLFSIWAYFFGISALVFCVLTAVIVWWMSGKITRPIVDLTEKIRNNIEQVQAMKQDTSNDQQNKKIQF